MQYTPFLSAEIGFNYFHSWKVENDEGEVKYEIRCNCLADDILVDTAPEVRELYDWFLSLSA